MLVSLVCSLDSSEGMGLNPLPILQSFELIGYGVTSKIKIVTIIRTLSKKFFSLTLKYIIFLKNFQQRLVEPQDGSNETETVKIARII